MCIWRIKEYDLVEFRNVRFAARQLELYGSVRQSHLRSIEPVYKMQSMSSALKLFRNGSSLAM